MLRQISTTCLALTALLMHLNGLRASSVTCQNPSNERLEIASALYEVYTDPLYSNFSMNIVPCFQNQFPRAALSYRTEYIPSGCNGRRASSNCIDGQQQGYRSLNNEVFSSRSSCAVQYEIDIDELRVPRAIGIAKCSCLHCHRGTCQNVYSYIPMVRKECNEVTGLYAYRKSVFRAPVGCVCIKSRRAGDTGISRRRLVMHE